MTKSVQIALINLEFLLTCLLRGMTASVGLSTAQNMISTHMPLARHDISMFPVLDLLYYFYSHASCEAWPMRTDTAPLHFHFYSHASCEAWQIPSLNRVYFVDFYSHASCEAWLKKWRHIIKNARFLLTCLLRGMTNIPTIIIEMTWISTHMPLARHDMSYPVYYDLEQNFYSHASCEAWP